MNNNNINQSQKNVQENGCNSWTMNGSLDNNNRNLQYNLSQEERERNDERIMNLYKKAANNAEETFRKLLKESREGTAVPTFLLPSEIGGIRPTSTFGSRDEFKNVVKECLREILNENNQEMLLSSQKRPPPQNLSITDVNVVVPQQQNGSQHLHPQPLPSISTMFDGRRSMAATPINEIERQQISLSRTATPLPLRFQQPPNLRLQTTRMPFSSPTSLLPPLPSAPPTLQSPIFRAQSGNGSGSSSSSSQDTAGRVNQSHVPSCCRYPPPPFPPGISLEQYHVHLLLQAQQRNRFPFPQPLPPPSTPTPTTKSSTITENLQTAGNNPYLQQFPRIPLDQNEHERLNQMFYANVLRPPPTMQPPNSMHSQQSQQQQPQQPPSTPTPTKRSRKRKSSPEKCPSALSKSSDISQQQNNQSSTFPITPNMQQTNNGPILSSAAELFQPQEESEERLINVIQNPNVTIEENNNNNGNVDHDSDDVIIIEHNQGEPNPSRLRTPSLETPPPKLCIADNEEEEEDENEEPPPSKTRALTFSKSAIPPPNLSTLSSEASPLTTTSSPSTSESSPSPDITFNLETIKEFCEAHFTDKPMLKGYYKILQENRPKDLPKYLSTIGFAHNLQDSKKTMDNFFEFGKSNVSKLLAQAKQDPPKCSKCREMDVPLPETLITYLEEVEKSSSSNSSEIAKHALLKVIKFTCDALSNAMEKIFNSTKFCIGTSNPPPITKEVRNAVESAFKSADNYEKCSIIWNSEPLKNIKIGVAEEFYRLRILSDEEKKAIVKHCECEHEWIYKRPNTRRGRKLIDYD